MFPAVLHLELMPLIPLYILKSPGLCLVLHQVVATRPIPLANRKISHLFLNQRENEELPIDQGQIFKRKQLHIQLYYVFNVFFLFMCLALMRSAAFSATA